MAEQPGFYPNPESMFGMYAHEIEQDSAQVEQYAPMIQSVLLSAYRRRFEEKEHVLPPGTIEAEFANPDNPDFVSRQIERMNGGMEGGSRYIAVHYWLGGPGPLNYGLGRVVAIGKATPSRPRGRFGLRVKEENANCFVNDIASAKPGRGAGSIALHALLSPFKAGSEVILDAYGRPEQLSSENIWFRRLGFVPKGRVESPVEIAGRELEEFRMVANSVESVRQALIDRHAWLAESGL